MTGRWRRGQFPWGVDYLFSIHVRQIQQGGRVTCTSIGSGFPMQTLPPLSTLITVSIRSR